jgi:hypothetical protein
VVAGQELGGQIAIVTGGARAIGRAIAVWATEGRAASTDALQRYANEGLARGRDLARTLAARARSTSPSRAARRAALREQIPAVGERRPPASS